MSFWKKSENLILTLIVVVFFGGLLVWKMGPETLSIISSAHADPMTMPFQDENQKSFTLADFKGKPLIVNFWATWCPVCTKRMGSLNEFAPKFQAKGGQVLALSHDRNSGIGVIKAYYIKNDYKNLPIYLEPTGNMLYAFGATGLPTAVLINSEGQAVATVPGGFDWDSSDADELVATYFGIEM